MSSFSRRVRTKQYTYHNHFQQSSHFCLDCSQDPNAAPAPAPAPEPASVANPFNKMFQAMGISLGGGAPAAGAGGPGAGKAVEGLAANLRPAPGYALAAWALTQGKAAIEQVRLCTCMRMSVLLQLLQLFALGGKCCSALLYCSF